MEAEAAKAARKTPWSDGYVLVAELVGSYTVERYYREKEATAAASQIWRCWVLFREKGLDYEEVTYGGVGLTHDRYATMSARRLRRSSRRQGALPLSLIRQQRPPWWPSRVVSRACTICCAQRLTGK